MFDYVPKRDHVIRCAILQKRNRIVAGDRGYAELFVDERTTSRVHFDHFDRKAGFFRKQGKNAATGADLKQLNPTRTIVVSAMNGIAVVAFVLAGKVWWPQTVALLLGALAGGYFGARIGQALPAVATRRVIVAITVVMTAAFFWRAYA